jgi:acetolactate synthase-1/2/3 large subunit
LLSFVDYFVDRLKAQGVDTIFGLPGSAVGPLLERVLRDDDLRFVMARHESGAVAMADGYARAAGRLGVAMVTAGPGALNALPHLAVANADNSSVLLVTGQVARAGSGLGAFQESGEEGVDINAVYRPCVKHSRLLSFAGSAPGLVENALRQAVTGPRGAVHLSIPVDLYREPVHEIPAANRSQPGRNGQASGKIAPSAVDPAVCAEVLRLVLSARRPLILLGNGARTALTGPTGSVNGLAGFCERFAIPVATTTKGKGLFPERHQTALGVASIGGSVLTRAYLSAAPPDIVLVLGSSLGEWATRNWTSELQATDAFIQVDADPARIGRAYQVDLGITADVGAFLRTFLQQATELSDAGQATAVHARAAMLAELPEPVWRSAIRTGHDDGLPAKPQDVMRELREWLDTDGRRIVLPDAGSSTGWFTKLVPLGPSTCALLPWGLGSMGWANAAVIGAKIADPTVTCLTLTGDGGFLMNAVEISTAARHRVGAMWLVAQDDSYNTIRQGMTHSFPDTYDPHREDFGLGNPDLPLLAESLGATAYRVDHVDKLAYTLDQAEKAAAEQRLPQVVCVRIDPTETGAFADRHSAVSNTFR